MLGASFGIAVIIGNTILVGILRTPGDVAALLPTSALFLGVCIVGGLYALLGAISMAEPGGEHLVGRRRQHHPGGRARRSGGACAGASVGSVLDSPCRPRLGYTLPWPPAYATLNRYTPRLR